MRRIIAGLATILLSGICMGSIVFQADTYGTGEGTIETEMDTGLHKSLIIASGEISMGESIKTDAREHEIFNGLDADKGRFRLETPEYTGDINGNNITTTASDNRKITTTETDPMLVKEGKESFMLSYETTNRDASINWEAVMKNGNFRESITAAVANKPRKIYKASATHKSMNITRVLELKLTEVREKMEKLE